VELSSLVHPLPPNTYGTHKLGEEVKSSDLLRVTVRLHTHMLGYNVMNFEITSNHE
jgi:hypothetical protein